MITVYTDGSCIGNGGDIATAGAGIYHEDDETLNRAIHIPNVLGQTNQTGEIIAIKEATTMVDRKTKLKISPDSKTCINGLSVHLQKWEDNGFIGVANAREFQTTIVHLRKQKSTDQPPMGKRACRNRGNERADKLANEGRLKATTDNINLSIDKKLQIMGAKLKSITQSMATRAIQT